MNFQTCWGGVKYIDAPCPDNVRRLDMNAMPMVLAMQQNGLLVDKQHFRNFSKRLRADEERITEEVRALTGYYINIGSPDQIADLLFNPLKLGLQAPRHFKLVKSKKRFVVDDEALESIKGLHPCIPLFQDFTERRKLRTSYADVLPELADPKDGRVRTSLRITRQVGGRISSSEPNLMAQPTRSDLGKEIRDGFVAPEGKVLAAIDEAGIEMRCAAHDAKAEAMMETFICDGDIHNDTASRIFRIPINKLDKMKHRYPAKRIGFGILFGIEAEGLRDQILVASDKSWTEKDRQDYIDYWTLDKCAETIGLWYEIYPEIRAMMSEQYSRARRYGFVWDWWGRIRWIPEAKSVHKWIVAAGLRQAGSLRVSASAQGTMKLSMAEIAYKIEEEFHGEVKALLQIHDELLFEGSPSVIADAMPRFQKVINNCVRLDVPIKSDYDTNVRWGAMKK